MTHAAATKDWRDDAWIVWDKTVPPIMQRGPIGTEREVRDDVRMREFRRAQDPHCRHEIAVRYVAKRLLVSEP